MWFFALMYGIIGVILFFIMVAQSPTNIPALVTASVLWGPLFIWLLAISLYATLELLKDINSDRKEL